jgi:hypothetical protein
MLSGPQELPDEQAGVVALAGQQVSPGPPHLMQRLSWQVWPAPQVAVYPDPQQGWLRLPQPVQLPPVQVPASDESWPQVCPGATHEPPKQQAPPPQVLPVQQAAPGAPQVLQ